jgi:L-2-hydroxyglutarate oxidase
VTTSSRSTATFVVVGGGLIGLASAWTLLRRFEGAAVVVLEKEAEVGTQQSGHNSGVVHAGLYYEPGSLKSRLCADGRSMLAEFCGEFGVSFDRCGKVVVALTEDEDARLDVIVRRAHANGVSDAVLIRRERLLEIEPHVEGRRALHSPGTSIVDFVGVCRALREEIVRLGGEVRTHAEVVALEESADTVRVDFRSPQGGRTVTAEHVLLCAGLQSDRVARLAGGPSFPAIVPFRGEYYQLKPDAAALVRGLIYPVPDPRYPFLGVHLTRHHDGSVLVGPNAVMAMAREGYDWKTWSARDLAEVARRRGFWSFARQNWRTGVMEVRRSFSAGAFAKAVQRYVPEVRKHDLVKATAGVRAQAMHRDGTLEDDFVIERGARILALRNAPSPAATSSLAIAKHIVDGYDSAGRP